MIKKWDIAPAPSEKNPARHKLLIKGDMRDIFLVFKKLGGICSRPEKTAGNFDFVIYLSKLEPDTIIKIKSLASELRVLSDTTPPALAVPDPFEPPLPSKPAPVLQPAPEVQPQTPPPSAMPSAPEPAPSFQPAPEIQAAEAVPDLFEAPRAEIKTSFEEPPLPSKPASVLQPALEVQPQTPPPSATPIVPEPAYYSQSEPEALVPLPADSTVQPAPEVQPQTPPPSATPIVPETREKAPEAAPQIFDKSKTKSNRGMPVVPSASSSAKAGGAPKEKLKKAPQTEEAPAPAASFRSKPRWSVELPLVPTHNFHTLVSGSHNRFAHAAAMAVVENPGMIYNPLLVFGVPGTGKTHFVHSIAYGIAASIGQNNIFVTDGIKLSRGVDIAIKDGTIGRLEEVLSGVKALIIDDVHLLMLTETNKKYISKWLNEFMTKSKQIMVTSMFPPKSLGGLEEAVGFQFTQGWMVDLKSPAPQTYKAILSQLLQGMDIKLSDVEINNIFVGKGVPFSEVVRILEGMKKLERFSSGTIESASHANMLEMLLGLNETEADGALTEADYDQASGWNPSAGNSWFKWGIFYPKGMKREAQYALYRTHERSAELGFNIEWQQVFMEEYSPDEIYGTPFKIGGFASEHNVNGVIILGPQPASALGAQEAEFRQITMKILESFLVKGTWIQAGRVKSPAAYARILVDLS